MIDGSLELFPSNCHICFVLCVILMGCVFARCLFACLVYVGSGRGGIEDVLCLRFRSFSLFRFFVFASRWGVVRLFEGCFSFVCCYPFVYIVIVCSSLSGGAT